MCRRGRAIASKYKPQIRISLRTNLVNFSDFRFAELLNTQQDYWSAFHSWLTFIKLFCVFRSQGRPKDSFNWAEFVLHRQSSRLKVWRTIDHSTRWLIKQVDIELANLSHTLDGVESFEGFLRKIYLLWVQLSESWKEQLTLDHSADLSVLVGAQPCYPPFQTYLILPDHQVSCNANKISTTIYYTKCTFTFYITNVFGCFCHVIDQVKLLKHKFPNWTTLHINQCSFQLRHGVKKGTTC